MALVETKKIVQSPSSNEHLHSSFEDEDFAICKSPEKLRYLLQKISPDCCTHFISDGDWSMHDLTLELVKNLKPAEIFITTYAIRELPIRQLILAQERNEISSVSMLLDYRAKTRTPEVFHLASQNVNKIFLTSIHAKVTVIRSAGGCVTIVGSSNWTQNPRIEAGIITMKKEVANFHIEWIKKVMADAEIFS